MTDEVTIASAPPSEEGPPIIILCFERKSYYLYKGEEFLDDILLEDGEFPSPALCVHFESIIDARRMLGDTFSTATSWSIHPTIIARMIADKKLAQTDA